MSRLELLKKVQERQKEVGVTLENIAKLSSLGSRTVARFFSGKDVKLSTAEKITEMLGLDFAGNEVVEIKVLKERRAKERALYIVSLVQDTSSLEMQGLKNDEITTLLQEVKEQFLYGKYQKKLWAS